MSDDYKVIPIPANNGKWDGYAEKLRSLKLGDALELSGTYQTIRLGLRKTGLKFTTRKIAHNLFAVWESREDQK